MGARTPPQSLLVVRPTLAQGGADRVTVNLLQALDRSAFVGSLALFRREGPYLDDIPADVAVDILDAGSLWTAWLPLARLIKSKAPGILFSTCSGTNVAACLATLVSGRRHRLVLSERNVVMRDQPLLKRWLMFAAKRTLYRLADCVTAVSAGVASDLENRLGVDRSRIRIVYNPLLMPELDALSAEHLTTPPFDSTDPIVLAAGRLVPAKGFDVLLDAFAHVAEGTPAHLVILGEGPLKDELRAQSERLGISHRVHLPGFHKNPFRFMARAAVFVLSSRYEGLPGVLIQAMACGAPAVATRCHAGPTEIIEDGIDGLLVEVDDVRAMAAAIQRLLTEPALRQRLARAGRRRASAFSEEAILPLYQQALLGTGHGEPGRESAEPGPLISPAPDSNR